MAKAIAGNIYQSQMASSATVDVSHSLVSAKQLALRESWFRDAIYENPELVIAPCRAGGLVEADEDEEWFSWATEFPLEGAGRVDVLLISSLGRIGLVETKLSYNPEKRREVVAQLLEYALALQDCDIGHLPDPLKKENWPSDEDIKEQLAAGEFLLIVAGDALDPRAVRLAEGLLGRHLTSGWDLAMVEMNLFQSNKAPASFLVVPELRGVVEADRRQVVRVIVEGETPRAKVQVERRPSITVSGRRNNFGSADDFLSSVKSQHPDRENAMEQAVTRFREIQQETGGRFQCDFGSSTANLYWVREGDRCRIFALNIGGRLRVWLDYLVKKGRADLAAAIRPLAAKYMGVSASEIDSSAAVLLSDQNVANLLSMIDAVVKRIDTMTGTATNASS